MGYLENICPQIWKTSLGWSYAKLKFSLVEVEVEVEVGVGVKVEVWGVVEVGVEGFDL